jgi:hypothetical protein
MRRQRTLSIGVFKEEFDHVNVLGAREGVSTDANAERLAETNIGSLRDGLVGEGTGTGDDTYKGQNQLPVSCPPCTQLPRTNLSRFVNVARHDAHLASKWVNDTWAVRTNKTGLGLASESVGDL